MLLYNKIFMSCLSKYQKVLNEMLHFSSGSSNPPIPLISLVTHEANLIIKSCLK